MRRIHPVQLVSSAVLLTLTHSLIGLATSAATHAPTRASNNIVDLSYAKYHGNLSYSDTVAYLGLPYAEPPVGELRFRAPVPLNTTRVNEESGGQVVDASQYPDMCVQGSPAAGIPGGAGTEDCLKVNVYAPSSAKPGDNLPVLVYIHSGSYLTGNPSQNPFDPWIHQMPDVVIVSMYYRLANLGFLSHPAFTADPSLGDHSVGFLDQVESLRWVQKYISRFGGDPGKVTINGLSAGAAFVELHVVSPVSKGLFIGAIAQSVYRASLMTPEEQVPIFNLVADAAGCSNGTIAAQMSCLRTADINAITAGSLAATDYSEYNTFGPVFDGKIFPTRPTESFKRGIFNKVNLMVGASSNDTLAFGITTQGQLVLDTNITASLLNFFPTLTANDLTNIAKHYPASEFSSDVEQLRVTTGESEVRCAAEIMADAVAHQATTYVYRYNTPSPVINTNSGCVDHGAENWMMFNGVVPGGNGSCIFMQLDQTQQAFAEELIAYWLSFVRTGNPNTYKLSRAPEWPVYAAPDAVQDNDKVTGERKRIVLTQGADTSTSGSTVEVVPQVERDRCEFVASMAGQQEN